MVIGIIKWHEFELYYTFLEISFLLYSVEMINRWLFRWNIFEIPRKISIHYSDVLMTAITSHITGVSTVCSTVCPGADQRKHQSFTPPASVGEVHQSPVDCPNKWPVTRKCFHLKTSWCSKMAKLSSRDCCWIAWERPRMHSLMLLDSDLIISKLLISIQT